ncbi:hypothetical protein [Halogeometricum luteum]|uniref:TFIIB zinc-binding n=1 Tax=Halogeometricum luteum TaxID=2950537 RepID=A0ABU2G9Y0_9EURY|nr:hypothetical protein [Halogeometricum sp. S3BR5-2]MDS0297109.1 hypothetical protein [Halogeometricum sp. S3BR5-2]
MNANMKCPDCHTEYRHLNGTTFVCEGCSDVLEQTDGRSRVLEQDVHMADVTGAVIGTVAAAVVFIPF